MKLKFFVVLLFFGLFLFGCVQQSGVVNTVQSESNGSVNKLVSQGVFDDAGGDSVQLNDCVEDVSCFKLAVKSCGLAKVKLKLDTAGSSEETVAESLGKKDGKCEFYYKVLKFNVTGLLGIDSQGAVDKVNAVAKGLEGKEMTCFATQDMAQNFGVESIRLLSALKSNCTGSLTGALADLDATIMKVVGEALGKT